MASLSEISLEFGLDPYSEKTKTCSECNETFTTKVDRAECCSQKCRVRKSRRLKKEGKQPEKRAPFNNLEYQRLRRRILNEYKIRQGCARCGYNEHPAALHFDHRDHTQKAFNISQDPKRSWESIEAEIAKCDVLCANCHSVRTHEEQHIYYSARLGTT